jgi:hypothetical protein
MNAICLPIYREINQERSGYLPSRELLVSPWSGRKNQRAADLGKLSAICVFMRFYAFLCVFMRFYDIAHHLLAA